MCVRYGLTSVQTNDDYSLAVYLELMQKNLIPIRIFLTPIHEELNHTPFNELFVTRPRFFQNEANNDLVCSDNDSKLIVERVKIFSDGSLGAETAALRSSHSLVEPISPPEFKPITEGTAPIEEPLHTGMLIHKTSELRDMIVHAKRHGFRLEIHAIGDAAAEQVL